MESPEMPVDMTQMVSFWMGDVRAVLDSPFLIGKSVHEDQKRPEKANLGASIAPAGLVFGFNCLGCWLDIVLDQFVAKTETEPRTLALLPRPIID